MCILKGNFMKRFYVTEFRRSVFKFLVDLVLLKFLVPCRCMTSVLFCLLTSDVACIFDVFCSLNIFVNISSDLKKRID